MAVHAANGQTVWYQVAVWGNLVEASASVKQGDQLGASGSLDVCTWTGADGKERTDHTVTVWVLSQNERKASGGAA